MRRSELFNVDDRIRDIIGFMNNHCNYQCVLFEYMNIINVPSDESTAVDTLPCHKISIFVRPSEETEKSRMQPENRITLEKASSDGLTAAAPFPGAPTARSRRTLEMSCSGATGHGFPFPFIIIIFRNKKVSQSREDLDICSNLSFQPGTHACLGRTFSGK